MKALYAYLMNMTRRELVENWNEFMMWASTRCFIIAGAIQSTYQMLPDEMKAQVPASLVYWATMGVLMFGVFGRITKPKAKDEPAA